jgi:predicted AlkP superfamily pyrophosphatase or phosphodiesterase
MPNRVCVIDLPGLSRRLLESVPASSALGKWLAGKPVATLLPPVPAVTCPVQATLTTGRSPGEHGIVANGIATFRSSADQALIDDSNFAAYRRQISFWEQSNQLLDLPRFWQDSSGRSKWKTALLFMQNSMPGFAGTPRPAADIVLTPKPEHGPDGRIVSLCWSEPRELVGQLFKRLGPFPLMNYWGPLAGIASSQWIAKAAAWVSEQHAPQLQWTYVPHLDYDLQRFGPSSPQARKAVEDVANAIEPLVQAVVNSGGRLVVLSEYAMSDVSRAIAPNRLFAEAGLLVTRDTPDGALIDYERSTVAMVDHQVAYVYVRGDEALHRAKAALPKDVEVLDSAHAPRHRRAGDLVLLAPPGAWFDYRWWSKPADAPAFARMVDIHRKPGYDPLELFWDRAANVTAQDASLVRGSHGRADDRGAVLISDGAPSTEIQAADVGNRIIQILDT